MSLAPGTRLGPYDIATSIGAGGMGEVYRARDIRLQRDVAVKVLPAHVAADPSRLHRFEEEARGRRCAAAAARGDELAGAASEEPDRTPSVSLADASAK